jgi:ribosomal protein S18 acetylase RimI-like enzyme
MSGPASVRLARADENAVVADVLTDAFVDEAGLNYWLLQGPQKTKVRKRFFDAAVGDVIHKERQLWLAEADGAPAGAAIWLKPGDHAFAFTPWQQLATTPLFISIAGFGGMQRAQELGGELNKHHPKFPHAHLVFLGVASPAQGRGVGSAILKETLAPLDKAGVAAYLECTTERNAALYQRHGFIVTGEFERPGLHFWCMTRTPRG